MLVKEYMGGLDKDADGLLTENITMSYYTDSMKLQSEIELYIDKRSGKNYGPARGITISLAKIQLEATLFQLSDNSTVKFHIPS